MFSKFCGVENQRKVMTSKEFLAFLNNSQVYYHYVPSQFQLVFLVTALHCSLLYCTVRKTKNARGSSLDLAVAAPALAAIHHNAQI